MQVKGESYPDKRQLTSVSERPPKDDLKRKVAMAQGASRRQCLGEAENRRKSVGTGRKCLSDMKIPDADIKYYYCCPSCCRCQAWQACQAAAFVIFQTNNVLATHSQCFLSFFSKLRRFSDYFKFKGNCAA